LGPWLREWRSDRRGFATASFTVPASGTAPAQALFVVGLNERKFFGQDGAEEGLKLLERVAEHDPNYQILLGLEEIALELIEKKNKVKHKKLTPSRELEAFSNCEMIPIVQAGMVDDRPRRALGRTRKTSVNHVAWMLMKHPREAVQIYWAFWRRKQYKDAARYKFWSEHLPNASHVYFNERAELVAIRAVEHMTIERVQGRRSVAVLAVSNEIFTPVVKYLNEMLEKDGASKIGDPEFSRQMRDRASELCLDVPDLTPVLILIYLGIPLLLLRQLVVTIDDMITERGPGLPTLGIIVPDDRD